MKKILEWLLIAALSVNLSWAGGFTTNLTDVTARTAAAAAQTTANTGVTNAAAAQTTANTGVTNAAAAQTTANTGVTNAAAAQTTANTGVTNAATAQTTAAAAQTTANNAVPRGMSAITNSLTSNVALNNTALYFDGPSVAQGTVGTWFVMGQFCYETGAAAPVMYYKLWDGTTIISSGVFLEGNGTVINSVTCFSLGGIISNPTGNIKISVRDNTSISSQITFNSSGVGKDSTISAIRIN
jgi:hypothetical protein